MTKSPIIWQIPGSLTKLKSLFFDVRLNTDILLCCLPYLGFPTSCGLLLAECYPANFKMFVCGLLGLAFASFQPLDKQIKNKNSLTKFYHRQGNYTFLITQELVKFRWLQKFGHSRPPNWRFGVKKTNTIK